MQHLYYNLVTSFHSQWLAPTTTYPATTLIIHFICRCDVVSGLLFSIGFTTVDHSSKSCKLVWLRSLPIAFQVDMVLFEQEFHHYSIQQDIITKSTVKCTAGSTPINTPVLNLIASQTNLHRKEIPVCQPFEGAVDRGSSSFPVLSKLSPKSFVESKQ